MSTPEQRAELSRNANTTLQRNPEDVDARVTLILLDELKAAEEKIAKLEKEVDEAYEMAAAHEQKFRDCPHKSPSELDHGPCACSYDHPSHVCMVHSPALKAAEARIAELESRKPEEGRWISVEERLPNELEQVLVAWPTGDISIDFKHGNGWGAPIIGGPRQKAYTYWQPLPPPPAVSEAKEGAWVCNQCGSREYTGSVLEDAFEDDGMSCGRCGGTEFHWEGPK